MVYPSAILLSQTTAEYHLVVGRRVIELIESSIVHT